MSYFVFKKTKSLYNLGKSFYSHWSVDVTNKNDYGFKICRNN